MKTKVDITDTVNILLFLTAKEIAMNMHDANNPHSIPLMCFIFFEFAFEEGFC